MAAADANAVLVIAGDRWKRLEAGTSGSCNTAEAMADSVLVTEGAVQTPARIGI